MSDSSIPPDDDVLADITAFLGDYQTGHTEVAPPETEGFADLTFSETSPPPADIEADIVEDQGTETDTGTIGDGACTVCGAPTFRPPGLTATGRKKRAPKYCDLHTPSRRISDKGTQSSNVESQLQKVQEELADDLRLLAALLGPMLPVTGYYVFEAADPFTNALLKLAKNNTRVLRVLHRVAQVAPIYEVSRTVAGTAYSIQVDLQRADPHSLAGERLGVARAYDSVYPEEVTNTVSRNGWQGPPRYATVPQ